MKKAGLLAIILLVLQQTVTFAQCCSMGNPLAGLTYSGNTGKGQFQLNVYFKHGFNETYFRKNVRLINYGLYSYSAYDFAGLAFSYGISNRISIEHETGYYIRKEIHFNEPELEALVRSAYGLSNGIISGRYQFLPDKPGRTGLAGGVGLRYPFRRDLFQISNVELPIEIQPSTGAFGVLFQLFVTHELKSGIKFNFSQRSEFNFRNKYDYLYGNMHTSTIAVSGRLYRMLFAQFTIRNEYKRTDKSPTGAKLASEGSDLIIASPKLGMQLPKGLHLSVFGDFPLFKYYFGEQLSMQYAAGVSLSKAFK